jgi:hypothetical protein
LHTLAAFDLSTSELLKRFGAERHNGPSSSFQLSAIGITLVGAGASRTRRPKEEIQMRLVDNLRKAEEKGVMSIRRSMERARDEWSDVERRIRQRMRIYPHKQKAAVAGAGQMNVEHDVPEQSSAPGEQRKPIVSIHGQDL